MNFRSSKLALALASVAAISFTGVASAQEVQSTCYGCVTTTPAQPTFAPGLSFSAWQFSSAFGGGQNAGGDGNGAVTTFALNDSQMNLVGRLGANTQGDICEVNCNYTLNTFEINSSIGAGALATNQGVGNGPVSSSVGTQAIGMGAMQLRNVFVPVPSAPAQ